MKKILRQLVSLSVLVFSLTIFSGVPVFAATEWGVGVSNDGSVSVGIGTRGSGAANVWGGGAYGGGWSLSNPYGLPQGSLLGIASNLLFWLLTLFAIFGVIGFILSGIWYLLSAGEESMAEKGKEGMKWSIVGIIVGLSGFIIMQAVSALLGGSSKTF